MTKGSLAHWQSGDVLLDQYEVLGILGEGGMGTVYHVHHRGWNQDLALKRPKPQVFEQSGGKEGFIREAETWVNLRLHPHIVSCYYVRQLEGIPCIFAEYLAGGSLSDWIRQRRLYEGGYKVALERIMDVAIQFAWGLHAAHEQGLIHQDIKPANIMMTREGITKITDFGLAKARTVASDTVLPEGEQSILVSSGGMTQAYCSPEQAQGRLLSRKTDIWSWGLSILHMFVGKVTWGIGIIAREALARHQVQDPAIPAIPTDLVMLLARCFQPQPEDRPATMREVADTLQAIYGRLMEHPYPRQAPQITTQLASNLNNRALSLYDLGKVENAMRVWEQALEADPQHVETLYNRGIILWRKGELFDDTLVQQMETLQAQTAQDQPWRTDYLLAQVYLERGDTDAALPLLEKATQEAPQETEVQMLFQWAQTEKMIPHRSLCSLTGHTRAVNSVSLSADGRLALSGSMDQTMRLWETESGRCLRTFMGHVSPVYLVCLSTNGHLALSMDWYKMMRLWETESGRCLHTFTGHTSSVNAICLSVDGHLALSGNVDGTIRLWETESGRGLRTFTGHTGAVNAVCLSADGHLALSRSVDQTMRLWETKSGRGLRTFTGHTGAVNAVCLSADGHLALSGSMDGTIRLWEIKSGRCLHTFRGHTREVTSVSLSADGSSALSGSKDGLMRLWEIKSGRCLRTFRDSVASVSSVCLAADGSMALLGNEDGIVQIQKLNGNRWQAPFMLARVSVVTEVLQMEQQATTWLVQAKLALQARRFSKALGLLQSVRAQPGWERAPRLLEAWDQMTGYCQKTQVWESWELHQLQGHTSWVSSICLSADGSLALSGSRDQAMRLWEVESGRCLHTFTGHTQEVSSVCLSADGHLALSGSWDRTMRLWEVESGRCLRTFKGYTQPVNAVSLSADGSLALSGSWDQTMRLWKTKNGRCLRTFKGYISPVNAVSLSADGSLALSGSKDGLMQLWETKSGRCLRTFTGHTQEVSSVSLSADGSLALSGSWDQTMRLWKVETGRCLRTFTGYTSWVSSVCLSADGSLALSGSKDGAVRLWKLYWELEAHDLAD